MASLQWFGVQAMQLVTTQEKAVAKAGLVRLRELIRQAISEPSPPRSLPGDFPHKETGDLYKKMAIGEFEDSGWSLSIFSDHAPHLEFGTSKMAPRPFVQPILDRYLDEIRDYAESKAKVVKAVEVGEEGGDSISDADVSAALKRLKSLEGRGPKAPAGKAEPRREHGGQGARPTPAARTSGGRGGGDRGGKRKGQKGGFLKVLEKEIKRVQKG